MGFKLHLGGEGLAIAATEAWAIRSQLHIMYVDLHARLLFFYVPNQQREGEVSVFACAIRADGESLYPAVHIAICPELSVDGVALRYTQLQCDEHDVV